MTTTNYGSEIDCFPDLNPAFAIVTDPMIVVGQAIARRLMTPRGGLLNDPNYGFDTRALLGGSFTPSQLYAIQSAVEQEALKDERVLSASASVTLPSQTGAMRISLSGQLATGTFTYVLNVSQVTVALESFS